MMKRIFALICAVVMMCTLLVSCGQKPYEGFYEVENIEDYGEDAVFTIEIKGEECEMVTKTADLEFIYTGNCFQCGESEIVLEFTKCIYTLEDGQPVEQDVDDDEEDLYLNFKEGTLYNDDEELYFRKAEK